MSARDAYRVVGVEEQRTVATSFRGKAMTICDLCGEAKDCLQKEIEGKEYDICSGCWNPFAQKLSGKGRMRSRETVFLPPPRVIKEREDEEPEPLPGEPPRIWGAMERPH
jgi:hypothetical protein